MLIDVLFSRPVLCYHTLSFKFAKFNLFKISFLQLAEMDLTTLTTSEPVLIIQSLKKGGDPMALQKTLEETTPNYVIMYTADIATVRLLEVREIFLTTLWNLFSNLILLL